MAPQTMKAIKIVSAGKAEVQTVPLPRLRDNYILVKVKHVAINPTDWKHIDIPVLATPGVTVGCDFSGTVVELGPNCTRDYKPGDRVSGVNHGSNTSDPEDGCFAEYAVVKEGAAFKTPENLSDEQAASVGVGVTTIAISFHQKLGMSWPGERKGAGDEWVLVYGGSTATGSLAIQSAVLSGYKVVTTCSPRNFDFVKSLGASAAFDYADPTCSKQINEATSDSLKLALDCIAEGSSPEITTNAMASSGGGKVAYLLPAQHSRQDVENHHVFAYTAIGEPFSKFGMAFPAAPEDYAIASKFWALAGGLFAEGKLVPHPAKVGKPGLEGVLEGLQVMREGRVSGVKLVHAVGGGGD